ncbi:MAG: UDP-2,4-diacetamido-2,4,6-trideoxy-beta-L-altropyranose hydrolase [Rhodospirillales bacterium]|nr:UDP-2,4-diacetamido-2,4,6-trideoxy-beta-L-altropyranose hydrolase [Rhodospirillales bacterium]
MRGPTVLSSPWRTSAAWRAPHAVFRCDASVGLGGGHLQRCLTLARALSARGWRTSMAMREASFVTAPGAEIAGIGRIALRGPDEDEAVEIAEALGGDGADLVVVDHYQRDRRFESACRHFAGRIAVIDDLADRRRDTDLLVDQTFGREAADYARLVPAGCRLLCGSGFALLRQAFLECRPLALARRRVTGPARRILVAMGATDAANATAAALDALGLVARRLPNAFSVDVVLGASAPYLAEIRARQETAPFAVRLHVDVDGEAMAALMTAADLGVGAGGTMSWERCCLGLPAVVVVTAANQETIAANVEAAGACRLVDAPRSARTVALADAVAALCTDDDARREMSDAAATVCDGLGTHRVAGAITEMMAMCLHAHGMSFA